MGAEAFDESDADLDFGNLAVRVPCSDALAEVFETPHLCLDPPAGVVSGPALPEFPAVVTGGAQGFVSGDRGGAILFSRPSILADRNDRGGIAVVDRRMAAARVVSAIGRRCADLFAFVDLVEKFRQHRTVANAAGGEFHCPNV